MIAITSVKIILKFLLKCIQSCFMCATHNKVFKFFSPFLCILSLQDLNIHRSPQLSCFFFSSNSCFYITPFSLHGTCSVIHLLKRTKQLICCFPLLLLPPVCPISVEFFQPSFLMMWPQNFSCFFFIVSSSFLCSYSSFLISYILYTSYSQHLLLESHFYPVFNAMQKVRHSLRLADFCL